MEQFLVDVSDMRDEVALSTLTYNDLLLVDVGWKLREDDFGTLDFCGGRVGRARLKLLGACLRAVLFAENAVLRIVRDRAIGALVIASATGFVVFDELKNKFHEREKRIDKLRRFVVNGDERRQT